MGTKKLGRPFTGDKPLSKDMKVKIDEDSYIELQQIANLNGVTLAEVIRWCIKEYLNKKEK